jgi:hypothetical protein
MKNIFRSNFQRLYILVFFGYIASAENARPEERVNVEAEIRIIVSRKAVDKAAKSDPALDISIDLLIVSKNLINSHADGLDPSRLVTLLKCVLPSLEKSIDLIDYKKIGKLKAPDMVGHLLGDFKRVLDASSLLIEARKTEGDRIYPANQLLLERSILPLDKMIKLLTEARRITLEDE